MELRLQFGTCWDLKALVVLLVSDSFKIADTIVVVSSSSVNF